MPNAWLNPGMSHDGLGHVFPFLTFEEAGEGGHLGANIYGGSLSLCQFVTKLKQEGGA